MSSKRLRGEGQKSLGWLEYEELITHLDILLAFKEKSPWMQIAQSPSFARKPGEQRKKKENQLFWELSFG
jgi:hypothetical protein